MSCSIEGNNVTFETNMFISYLSIHPPIYFAPCSLRIYPILHIGVYSDTRVCVPITLALDVLFLLSVLYEFY